MLRRAIEASPSLRLSGKRMVSVLREGQVEQHEEIVLRDGLRTRIEFPSGSRFAGQIVVEDQTQRRHWLPLQNEVRLLPPRRDESVQRLRALIREWSLSTEPGEKIAGVPTVDVVARDGAGNTLQRLSIDPKSGAVLRQRVFDAVGTEVGGFQYSQVNLSPPAWDESVFKIDRKGATVTTPWDMLRRLARRGGFSALGLPTTTGYRLDGVRISNLPVGPVLVQNYVGPGGRLALYQLRAKVDPAKLKSLARNRLRTHIWTRGDRTFVLLGNQDSAALAKLKSTVTASE